MKMLYFGSMVDTVSKQRRSEIMALVKCKHTAPELKARSLLHRMGYRFTVNGPQNQKLPGKPDIVLPKYGTVVFVHGCFWHQHPGCNASRIPKSSGTGIDWTFKLEGNASRDKRNERKLRRMGWRVLTVWECQTNGNDEALICKFKRYL
ncbi:MAG: DNA mismatch endonuclease Vsr [Kiritimatiellae bacterium]|jgi:DNA mismatch endonuclease (patch repair protein)|nr:DNA mismatch endonuclease Vsr [Kiritimatiellia bacterium]